MLLSTAEYCLLKSTIKKFGSCSVTREERLLVGSYEKHHNIEKVKRPLTYKQRRWSDVFIPYKNMRKKSVSARSNYIKKEDV